MVRTARRPASDEELLARTASDPKAFGVFYDRFEAGLLGFFLRPTRRADVAASVAAEVFAEALASTGTFDPRPGHARRGRSASPGTSWPTPRSGGGSRTGHGGGSGSNPGAHR